MKEAIRVLIDIYNGSYKVATVTSYNIKGNVFIMSRRTLKVHFLEEQEKILDLFNNIPL